MKNIRLIDANALIEAITSETRNEFEFICLSRLFEIIDNAPTIEPFEPDYVGAERLKARQRGYEDGYHNGMKIGKTLNPKIKQGEWILKETNYDDGGNNFYECTNCHYSDIHSASADVPFCWHCGAYMGGAENNGK